jgi:hypothetical protein
MSGRPLSAEPAAARMPSGHCATAISAWPPAPPMVARDLRRSGAFRRVRGMAGVALLAANRRRRPATPNHTGPRNTWSDGTSSHVWHHPATRRTRLTVKQVHGESVLGLLTLRTRRQPLSLGRRHYHWKSGDLSRATPARTKHRVGDRPGVALVLDDQLLPRLIQHVSGIGSRAQWPFQSATADSSGLVRCRASRAGPGGARAPGR